MTPPAGSAAPPSDWVYIRSSWKFDQKLTCGARRPHQWPAGAAHLVGWSEHRPCVIVHHHDFVAQRDDDARDTTTDALVFLEQLDLLRRGVGK
jgi:hypothetical protein